MRLPEPSRKPRCHVLTLVFVSGAGIMPPGDVGVAGMGDVIAGRGEVVGANANQRMSSMTTGMPQNTKVATHALLPRKAAMTGSVAPAPRVSPKIRPSVKSAVAKPIC